MVCSFRCGCHRKTIACASNRYVREWTETCGPGCEYSCPANCRLFGMERHTLTIDWQVPAEFSGEGMGQGPASLCIIDEPSTQRQGGPL